VIQDVEGLQSELDYVRLMDVKVPEDRKIGVVQPRSTDEPASRVSGLPIAG
jgi:hypothetical protein